MNIKVLNEDKRGSLISQAKSGGNYSDTSKGKNRYDRRNKSRLASSVKYFNSIDMDKLFKSDILDVNIEVTGETNSYTVRISFSGFLDELHELLPKLNSQEMDKKTVAKALSKAYNDFDVYFNCTCPDFRYRHSYWATKKDNLIGDPESRPIRKDVYHAGGLEGANFYDDKGPACKHVILALKDSSWLIQVASVIFNYINYMKDHRERDYQKYIYPAVYQEPYPEQEVQLDITDIEQEEPTETEEGIDLSEYQELVDNDLEENDGILSTTTRALIDDAKLSLVKNTSGGYTVSLNRLYNTKPVQSTLDNLIKKNKRIQINKNKDIDAANKLAVERGRFQKGNEYRFQKNPNNVTKDQIGLNFDELEKEL